MNGGVQLAGRSLLATKSTTDLDATVKVAPTCGMDMVEYMPGLVYFGNSMRNSDYVCFVTEIVVSALYLD